VCDDELLHGLKGSQTAGYALGDRVWFMVVVGDVFNIEGEDLGVEGKGFGLILLGLYFEDDTIHLHAIINLK
jgi:hypothetical protein